ncbi:MAG TPA: ABC-F family ATP-binding cassette domain-containing protein, partial [Planctomycetota bacterium]|nr:ABC-F family ATP-binding cassette domain-containing protein [Planctomycetota bacterium]
ECLRGIDLNVARGDKLGCVGRNGAGKTTLLRLIEGEETADQGTVQLERGARIGYVVQRPVFAPGLTVRAFVEQGLEFVRAVEAELDSVGHDMAEAAGPALDALTKRHGDLLARMEFLGGWERERRVETVLSGIGLDASFWEREAHTLSGGEKSRACMARVLVSVPDVLLLDEPTNHLDLAGIEWLEEFLRGLKSAVLLVSHDRRLLDRLVETIVEVEAGGLTRYTGNYSKYVALKEERFQHALRTWELQQERIRKEEGFIKKHMGSQRTGEAKGRQKKLDNLERVGRPYNDVRRPRIRVQSVERGGEIVLEAHDLVVGHGAPLVSDVDMRLGRGERVGLVGPNGAGKTTLL